MRSRLSTVWRVLNPLARIIQLQRVNAGRIERLEQMQREVLLVLARMSLPPTELWQGRLSLREGRPEENVFPRSTLCRQDSFQSEAFSYWTRQLGQDLRYHRKLWEYVYICQALWERGAIRPGAKGLGFGVGREPLAAYFAAQDCQIMATDADAERGVDLGWIESAQNAAGLQTLRNSQLCPDDQFERNVAFRPCDMNHIPADLSGFDFCWSACAFEHLGSIEHGLAFIERSVECLKPGGWSVHTTELNLSSNDRTIDKGATVLFRRRDLEAVATRLTAKGHQVAPFDFDPGLQPMDQYLDIAPYREEPHLKVAFEGYATTSFGIIVQRAE